MKNPARQLQVLLLLLGLVTWTGVTGGHAEAFPEYKVKALFLFNFAKYVDWPEAAFPTPGSPIIIGLIGQDNFKDELNRAVEGKIVNGRAIVVKRVSTDPEMNACHILFVSSSEKSRLDEILGKTRHWPVLTVGELAQFLAKGGIVNFTLKDEKIRLEIDLDSARQAGVRISSKLLSVAEFVKGKTN
jgi:hypothetical protein